MSTNRGVSIPEYLNEDLFRDALNDGFQRKDIEVKSLSLESFSEGGENYCSDIFRAKVQYSTDENENQNIVLIVKDIKASFSESFSAEPKEIGMYMQMIPKMDEILGEADALTPKCFKATKDYNELYIFQDLEDLGYMLQDRLQGLNEEQAHVLLKKIAIFHAASMVVAEKHPDLIELVGKSTLEGGIDKFPILANLIYSNLEHVTELAKDWDCFEGIVPKLQELRTNYSEKFNATLYSEQSRFKVLNHGDLWVNNIMFKHEKDTCIDVKLIDFQICFYGSPGVDLHYFFTTSVPLKIGLHKKYDLLRSYYKSLKDTLAGLNYSPIPTWDDLLNEIRNTEFCALQSALMAVPLICLEKDVSKGTDLDTLKDPDLMKKQQAHMYTSKRTLEITRHVLDRLNDLGVLD